MEDWLQEDNSGDRRRNRCRRVGSVGGGYGTVSGEEHTACGWVGQAYGTAVALSSKKWWKALGPRDNESKTL